MGCFTRENARVYALPIAILGNAGIYDLQLFQDLNKANPMYRQIVEGAFGLDEARLNAVSPAAVRGIDGIEGGWASGRLAVLSHSPQDELLQFDQTLVMREVLVCWENDNPQSRRVELFHVAGTHDEVWQEGKELARAIAYTLKCLESLVDVM